MRLATMEAAAFKRLYPHEYYAKFISEGARPDGRPLGRARPTSVAVGVAGTAHGSALVKVGRTTVMAAVKLEACQPDPERPDVGFIDVVMEFPPMCSASTRPGRPNDESSFIARRIEDALVDSRAVDLKKLSIKTGLWAWRVCLDIYCLDHDGSVLDAGLMAALAALRDTKVPFVAVDDRGKLTYGGAGEKKKKDGDGGDGGGCRGTLRAARRGGAGDGRRVLGQAGGRYVRRGRYARHEAGAGESERQGAASVPTGHTREGEEGWREVGDAGRGTGRE